MEAASVAGDFLSRNRAGMNCPDKDGSRLFVFEHFRRNRRKESQMRMYLGLPGQNWVFERDLAKKYPSMKIIGVERNFGVINDGLFNMPSQSHSAKFDSYGGFPFVRRGTCSVIHGELSNVAAALPAGFSCGWLDFHCPIGKAMIDGVSVFIEKTDDRHRPVPLSVTMLIGREQSPFNEIIGQMTGDCPASKRATLLAEIINRRQLKRTVSPVIGKFFRYQSEGGSIMAVVNFKLESKAVLR